MRLVYLVLKLLKDVMGKKYLKLNLFINRDVKILNNYLIEYNNLYTKK